MSNYRTPVYPELQLQSNLRITESLGQIDHFIPGLSRGYTPENAIALLSTLDPAVALEAEGLLLPAVLCQRGSMQLVSADYNSISCFKRLWSAADYVDFTGRNDQSEYPAGNGVSGVFTMAGPTPPNNVIGFELEWSIGDDYATSFSVEVKTTLCKNISAAPVNRHFTVQLGLPGEGGRPQNSGVLVVLFAQREEQSDTCGFTGGGGCTVESHGGQQMGAVSVLHSSPYNSAYIPGTTVDNPSSENPTITATLGNTALNDHVGMVARYITAASAQMDRLRTQLVTQIRNANIARMEDELRRRDLEAINK